MKDDIIKTSMRRALEQKRKEATAQTRKGNTGVLLTNTWKEGGNFDDASETDCVSNGDLARFLVRV